MASDYSDGIAAGTYYLTDNGQTSTLVRKSDHTFRQELTEQGEVRHVTGTWRRSGEAGIAFSNDLLLISGEEPSAHGTPYSNIHKDFEFLVSIIPSQYDALWYGRVDPSPLNTISGTYAGDEPGVSATIGTCG